MSKSTVQRVWAQMRLKPHRLEGYMASDDPDFESKAADIIGLYLHPPQHAAVFCVDEKTAIPSAGPSSIRCCPFRRDAPKGTALNTIATARCRSTRHWM